MNIGHKHWTIGEGRISPLGDATIAFLNASLQDAHVQIFIYYTNREPAGPYRLTVPAERIQQVRFDRLTDPEPIPGATEYAGTIESDVPIVVQFPATRFRRNGRRGYRLPEMNESLINSGGIDELQGFSRHSVV